MKISILLIEDDRDMRDLVARHLEHSVSMSKKLKMELKDKH